ncbi:response regulator transcription factor [Sphingomonas xanthus]|uniref:Response regulator transcription factor n=1 Tax=Sphingomonas xanthus TaxID=2594473 RepID=A0A516IU40_9SPHN|nr:response regulator [Sphingomonas xanthus]QDP20425.1 response regulator transcription factor [Sphingomonas xanthus]
MSDADRNALIYVVDDDADLGGAVARLLRRQKYSAEPFVSPEQLLTAYAGAPAACIITDVMMGELDGFSFAERVRSLDPAVAIIFMTAWPTTANAVDAIRRYGGLEYLEKPIDQARLLAAVAEGVAWSAKKRFQAEKLSRLTRRERQVFALLIRGLSTKAIAAELGLSPKTIEDHRARINLKTGATGLAQLIALADGWEPPKE